MRMPGLAVADVDGDRDLDVILCGQGDQAAAQVLLNDGTGQFTAGQLIGDHAVCPSCGDLDNDGDVDLWLGRAGGDQIWLNDGQGRYAPAPTDGVAGAEILTRVTSLADIDSDGDLDLLAFRCAVGEVPATEKGEEPAASSVYFNNADGTYLDRASDLGLQFAETAVASVIYDDFDNDMDLDLIVFPRQARPRRGSTSEWGSRGMESGDAVGLNVNGVFQRDDRRSGQGRRPRPVARNATWIAAVLKRRTISFWRMDGTGRGQRANWRYRGQFVDMRQRWGFGHSDR